MSQCVAVIMRLSCVAWCANPCRGPRMCPCGGHVAELVDDIVSPVSVSVAETL